MSVYIFLGPSLGIDDARGILDAVYLPPVSQGDVYRVARLQPKVIGIIDGNFESVPAVWHKEILWAMSRGINVFGSSSMGALRAAELADFGMVGVGEIFTAYRNGLIDDDDEVAVVHGPAEFGFAPLSEAMVNIRFSLDAAQEKNIVSAATKTALEKIAKAMFYPERNYPRIFAEAAKHSLPEDELTRLREWLVSNNINQKRIDALELLRQLKAGVEKGFVKKVVNYVFRHTIYWDDVVATAGSIHVDELGHREMVSTRALLEEVRLDAKRNREILTNATLWTLALRENRTVAPTQPLDTQDAVDRYRAINGLRDEQTFQRWLDLNHLTLSQLEDLLVQERIVERTIKQKRIEVLDRLPDGLKLDRSYERYAGRARHKTTVLSAHGLDRPSLNGARINASQLAAWYFAQAEENRPADMVSYVAQVGFTSIDDWQNAVLREWHYQRLICVIEPATNQEQL